MLFDCIYYLYNKSMFYLRQILLLFLLNFITADTFTGYIRSNDFSFCMEECGQFYIESEEGNFFTNVILLNQIDLFLDRYVEIEGEYVTCTECDALEIRSISILNDCISPVSCLVDPCEVSECWNPNAECVSNYCGGCYADFYNSLNGDLLDCSDVFVDECLDVGNIDFGLCFMYLGMAVVNGTCQGVSGCGWEVVGIDYYNAFHQDNGCEENCLNDSMSCQDIESNYELLLSDNYSDCEFDNDCQTVWGDCGVGLGGCHYSVNENYSSDEVSDLVDTWIDNDCMQWVCDCMDLPNAVCQDSECNLAYCYDENPVGCFSSGCDEGYICVDNPNNCVPSSCFCDDSTFFGSWICTEDCGGGTCVISLFGDVNYDGLLNVSDIVIIVNMILGNMEINISGDISGDDVVDIIDVVMIINDILNND